MEVPERRVVREWGVQEVQEFLRQVPHILPSHQTTSHYMRLHDMVHVVLCTFLALHLTAFTIPSLTLTLTLTLTFRGLEKFLAIVE